MKILSAAATAATISLGGCAGLDLKYSALAPVDNRRAFSITAIHGGPSGSREANLAKMSETAERLCGGAYDILAKDEQKRYTSWGSENGQAQTSWVVTCSKPAS